VQCFNRCGTLPLKASTTLGLRHCSQRLEWGSPILRVNVLISVTVSTSRIARTCIPSVIAHHSLILGSEAILLISASMSVPVYLNVANSVRSLSKKIESIAKKSCQLAGIHLEPLSLQSMMLHSLIFSRISGHTLAWHSLYAATAEGLRWTTWAKRRGWG
jgi:hypothetical protein